MGILPPGVKRSWDDCNVPAQAQLIAYSQVREHEEYDEKVEFAKAGVRMF